MLQYFKRPSGQAGIQFKSNSQHCYLKQTYICYVLNRYPIQQSLKYKNRRIAYRTGSGIKLVHTQQVLYGKAAGDLSQLFLVDKTTFYVTISLNELCHELNGSFFRINPTEVINLMYVTEYSNQNQHKVFLKQGHVLMVSKPKVKHFVSKMSDLIPSI
ncbi:MAG: LytTR family transcriptional regulator DNA-binding domain-containing protein [Bacteroidales bacterium]|nr:LytTR family transcriptional regulator DNA-binding domain-containing protein [Bacteroidales bacterium]MCF8404655.1 LytTR family transcriptional regulator DNA-binding domain-containing protein [Bacteroidales bacterium]